MKLGLALPQTGPLANRQALTEFARRAEHAGFGYLSVFERWLYPTHPLDRYPGSADGQLPVGMQSVLDPLEALTFAAACTQTIRLLTAVLVVPLHNPVLLARRVATLDVLSEGRVSLGVGGGWSQDEYHAAGVPFAERGRRLDDMLTAMRALWGSDPVTVTSHDYGVPPAWVGPKPVQAPHPPLYIGGVSPAALQRAARLGAGWLPVGLPPAKIDELSISYRRACASPSVILLSAPRLGAPRGLMSGTREEILEDLQAYAAVGVDAVVLVPHVASVDELDPYLGLNVSPFGGQ